MESENEIIYLYDPLCGWCYGFSQVMVDLHQRLGATLPFSVYAGGMMLGERSGPIGVVAPYVKTAYKRVEELTGVRFGQPFLAELMDGGKTIFDSEPPSRAGVILKEFAPKQAVHIAHEIQKVIYHHGFNPNVAESYVVLAHELGMEEEDFRTRFNDFSYKLATKDEFDHVAKFGVSGFPTLIYRRNDNYFLVCQGYSSLDQTLKVIESIQSESIA